MTSADELVELDDGWALWAECEVRSAGFPLAELTALGRPELVDALNAEQALRDEVSSARAHALQLLLQQRAAPRLLSAVRQRQSGLRTGTVATDEALVRLDDARARLDAASAETERRHAAAVDANLEHAWRMLQSPKFRRALLMQNRRALDTGLRAWAGPSDQSRTGRRAPVVVATYWQRYAAKNDTAGFYGPVSWGRFVANASAPVEQRVGARLVEQTSVHLEPWAVATLADALVQTGEAPPLPELAAHVHRDAHGALHGLRARFARGPRSVPPGWALVFERLAQRPDTTWAELLADEATAESAKVMRNQGVLVVRWPVMTTPRPAALLRTKLTEAGLTRAVAAVDRLEAARAKVEAAFDDETSLAGALDELDQCFVELTDQSPTRKPGETYASRTTTYANCRRGHQLQMGADVIAAVRAPLSLLLTSARWLTADVAAHFLVEFESMFVAAQEELGSESVPLVTLFHRVESLWAEGPPRLLREPSRRFEERWRALLPLDPGQRVQHFSSAVLREAVHEAFAASGPGFLMARHHSPDLMLAREGDRWLAVLGELHVGVNTLGISQAVDQHPDPAALRRWFRRDIQAGALNLLPDIDLGLCAHEQLLDDHDWHLDTGHRYASWLSPERTLRLGDFVVGRTGGGGGLECRHVPSGASFHPLLVFEKLLRLEVASRFRLPALTPHSPRVVLDQLVIARERWSLERSDFVTWVEAEGAERVRAAHRTRHERGWPRHVFARVPTETKPVFVDWASPLSLDVLCRLLRVAPSLELTEMLPSPHQTWLADAQGATHASECRLVAVDPKAWQPPGEPQPRSPGVQSS